MILHSRGDRLNKRLAKSGGEEKKFSASENVKLSDPKGSKEGRR